MTIELYVLSDDPEIERESMGRVRIGLGAEGEVAPGETESSDGSPLKLVFRAIFREDRDGAEWERRLTERLRESGVKVGNEFFFVNDAIVEGLCDAAAHADRHEWLSPPADAEFVELAMELGRARLAVDKAFDAWSRCARTSYAEIKINSYTQYIARNDRRVREYEAEYVTPHFYNDGIKKNTHLDYTISCLKDETRKWRSEIARLREEIAAGETVFAAWQAAVKRVNELEKALADRSSGKPRGTSSR